MSDYMNEEMFRTVRKGGYDKEDVEQHFKQVKADAENAKNEFRTQLSDRDKKIGRLKEMLAERDKEINRLEGEIRKLRKDIDDKYKTYIENYDMITQMVYDAKIQANQITKDAEAESDRKIRKAEAESDRIITASKESAENQLRKAQLEMNTMIKEGRHNYAAIQDEISELVYKVNQMQHSFMKSVKTIHEISDSVMKIQIEETDFEDIETSEEKADEKKSIGTEENVSMLDD